MSDGWFCWRMISVATVHVSMHIQVKVGTTFNLYKVKVLEESLLLLLPPPLLNSFTCCLCTTVILAVCISNYLMHHVNDHFINYY